MSLSLRTSLENLRLDGGGSRQKMFKVGLDYGTTYSAGAFCLCSGSTRHLESGRIYPFYGYGSEFDQSKLKNSELPSDIRYEPNGITKIGLDALKWTSSTGHSIRRAKLGLDDRPETASARTSLMDDIGRLRSDKEPIQVISDYLTELFGTFREQLISVGYEPHDSIELNCAVPSIWTHRARRSMVGAIKKAATRSGLAFETVIRLWPEAEAATEHLVSERPNLNLQKNDVFIVCDAGGGTVDFTTYSVQEPDPLCLKEVVEGSGALCGSTFIDQGFLKLVEARARACQSLLQSKSELSIQKQLNFAASQFRGSIKHAYSGLSDLTHFIQFSGLPEDEKNGLLEDIMVIENKDLFPIFEGVAEEVWVNLRSQLHQAGQSQHHAKFVLFTGGLSQSPFMRKYIKKKLAQESQQLGRSDGIELVYASTVEYSVAAGAIRCSLKAAEDIRTRRINSTSVGIAFSELYDRRDPRHKEEGVNKVLDETDKQYYVKNVIYWILTKGEEQPTRKTIKLYENIPANVGDKFDICVPLYACDHPCKVPYPMSYYRAKSQECYIWEEVTFTMDMSIIKARIQPKTAKIRRTRRPKTACRPLCPSRRSARLNGINEVVSQSSLQQEAVNACVEGFNAEGKGLEPASQQALSPELAQVREEDDDESRRYFRIQYSFSMEFVGLLAKYEFWCEAAQFWKKGSVSLPDCYDFGG